MLNVKEVNNKVMKTYIVVYDVLSVGSLIKGVFDSFSKARDCIKRLVHEYEVETDTEFKFPDTLSFNGRVGIQSTIYHIARNQKNGNLFYIEVWEVK